MVNELVTDAFGYACPAGQGDARVAITPREPGRLRPTISDQGGQLPSSFDVEKSNGLGLKLVTGLSHQLRGQFEWQDTRFVLISAMQEQTAKMIPAKKPGSLTTLLRKSLAYFEVLVRAI